MAESVLCGLGTKSVIFFLLLEQGQAGETIQSVNYLFRKHEFASWFLWGGRAAELEAAGYVASTVRRRRAMKVCAQLTCSFYTVLDPSPGKSAAHCGSLPSQ